MPNLKRYVILLLGRLKRFRRNLRIKKRNLVKIRVGADSVYLIEQLQPLFLYVGSGSRAVPLAAWIASVFMR